MFRRVRREFFLARSVSGSVERKLCLGMRSETEQELTGNRIDAAVDNDGSLFDPVAAHHFRLTNGHDENVGAGADVLEIHGLRVADGDGRVIPLQQLGAWSSDDPRSAENDGFLASDVELRALDEFNDTVGGAWQETAQVADRDLPFVDRVQAVDILFGRYCVGDQVRVDLVDGVQRHLNNDAVELRVQVQLRDLVIVKILLTFDRVFTLSSHLRQ